VFFQISINALTRSFYFYEIVNEEDCTGRVSQCALKSEIEKLEMEEDLILS